MSNLNDSTVYRTATTPCSIQAGRALCPEGSVRDRLGGPGPSPLVAFDDAPAQAKPMTHTVLSLSERIEIQVGLFTGLSQCAVAQRLGRSPGTISTELKRNGGGQTYCAQSAHLAATQRKARVRRGYGKIDQTAPLRDAVHAYLSRGWSPEEIAGTLKLQYPEIPHARLDLRGRPRRTATRTDQMPAEGSPHAQGVPTGLHLHSG